MQAGFFHEQAHIFPTCKDNENLRAMAGTTRKNVGRFLKNVGRFSKNVGDLPKNMGVFSKNVGVFFRRGGGDSSIANKLLPTSETTHC